MLLSVAPSCSILTGSRLGHCPHRLVKLSIEHIAAVLGIDILLLLVRRQIVGQRRVQAPALLLRDAALRLGSA